MTQIKAVIIQDAEQWIKDNTVDMTSDGISAVYRKRTNPDHSIVLFDEEEEEAKTFTLQEQVVALQKLADAIGAKELHVGGLTAPTELEDLCNWDVEVTDAYFQLIYHGEVIYG